MNTKRETSYKLIEKACRQEGQTQCNQARVAAHQITAWKREAIEKLAKVFDDKGTEVQANRDAEVTKLHAKIGQLVVERDFLAKAFDR